MRYKARRRQEVKARNERPPEQRMSEPPPIVPLTKEAQQPERVPFRTGPGTVREIRVSVLEADLEGWAAKLQLAGGVAELVELIRVRRYTPPPPPVAKGLRAPSWYVSDTYSGNTQYSGDF